MNFIKLLRASNKKWDTVSHFLSVAERCIFYYIGGFRGTPLTRCKLCTQFAYLAPEKKKNIQKNTANLNSIYTCKVTCNLSSIKKDTVNLDSIYTCNLSSIKSHTVNLDGIYTCNLSSICNSIFVI